MDACGRELARRLGRLGATKVLTAEISGIAPALTTAGHLGIPVVYARKSKPITMPDQIFLTLAPSHTKGRTVELIVSPEYLGASERILIIDDFLATGQTIMGLVRLAQAAGATRRRHRGAGREDLRGRAQHAGAAGSPHRSAGDHHRHGRRQDRLRRLTLWIRSPSSISARSTRS